MKKTAFSENAVSLLFFATSLFGIHIIALLESVNTSACINELLLTGKERMTA